MSERKYWHGCKDKQCYESGEAAQSAVRALKRKGVSKELKPYNCEYCEHWHLGTSGKSMAVNSIKHQRKARQVHLISEAKTKLRLASDNYAQSGDVSDYAAPPAVTKLGDILREALSEQSPKE